MRKLNHTPTPIKPLAERIFDRLFEKDGNRSCRDISDEACRKSGYNFFVSVAALSLTKLGDALANPKTVLAWLMTALGAPTAMIGWLVPLRESLSMLPQMAIANFIRQKPIRKSVWVFGSVAQAAFVAGMALTAFSMTGVTAGLCILSLLVGFSLARALCSIAIKDVLGKTIAKTRRGRVTGISESVAGGLTFIAVALLVGPFRDANDARPFVILLSVAAILWLVAAILYSRTIEFPGAVSDEKASFANTIQKISLVKTDSDFRRFVTARALFLVSALSGPYYVVLANKNGMTSAGDLGFFVLASGIASLIGSPIWGYFSDRSSRKVMMAAAGSASILGILLFLIVHFAPTFAEKRWIFPGAFFLLSLAHAGVRAGRKTFVVDFAKGNQRTDYVAVSNSIIGLILLLSGVVGTLLSSVPVITVILILSILGLIGVGIAFRLPEVQKQ